MPLRVKDLLKYSSLKDATCLTDSIGLENEVSGAIVIEALDIEEWGRPGLLLLTSYFALDAVSPEKIDQFFQNAKKKGIAGFVFKMDRLVSTIPPSFIENCEKYQLPLIQINKQASYEKIITSVLETIINRNAYLLENYYEIHQHFTSLMLSQPGIKHILENLQGFIKMPVTLHERIDGKVWGTDERYHTFDMSPQRQNLINKKYMNLAYQKITLSYQNQESDYPALSVSIPNLGYEEFELIVHHLDNQLNDIDFITIENAAIALQTLLIKQYALRQNNTSRLNETASDLLHGRFSNSKNIEETIQDLNLNVAENYRIIIIHFNSEKMIRSPFLANRFSDALINHAKHVFPNMLYVARKERVILITPVTQTSLSEAKQKVEAILNRLSFNELYATFKFYTSISNNVDVYNLPEGYRQAFDTQKIINMMGEENIVLTYQDLGIYQIFVESGNLNSLERFIPEKIRELQKANPDLLETLRIFIDVNQNFSETAQILFVHPKTVRYRIDRLIENYQIDFQNSEEILHYNIALRLLKILNDYS